MSRDTRNVVADIDALPTADGDDLGRLQELIDEYFASPAAAEHIDVWFSSPWPKSLSVSLTV
jgi:hypothetical protein